jgi:alpha-maltose-1-phosphate synthase
MKIGFLTPEFPHPRISDSGGIGTSIMNLSKGLINQGHQVIVLVYGQDQDAVFEDNGIVFYKIKNIKFKGISRFLSQKKIEKLINKLVSEKKIDIIEAPDWGMTSFIKTICPLVVRLHGSDTYFCHLDNRPVKWNNHFHEKRVLKNADAIVSVSKFTAELTNKLFKINRSFTVIPNCIDVENFNFNENITPDKHTILYFGTLIRKKGLLELPPIFNEVYKNNNQAKLILIGRDNNDVISGNSSTWQMMKELFSPDALQNVDYLGSVPYNEMKNLIEKATLCVFPTFAEALPVSWIEAMAMKKPIVASNIGWANEIVEDQTDGFLIYPKNHAQYAEKILALLINESLQKQIGTAARKKIIEKFNIDIVASQNVVFYNEMLKNKNENTI